MSEELHVFPVNDLRPHADSGYDCECQPSVKLEGDSVLVVHNAFDGRDIIEEIEGQG